MAAIDEALARVRGSDPVVRAGLDDGVVADGLRASGVRLAAVGGALEGRWHQALRELEQCIRPLAGSPPVLSEGGVYLGSWIESTGTINTELLSRFVPEVARDTHLLFAEHQREDGMIPYKVTDAGPAFSQIQIVTPLARGVWNQYLAGGRSDQDYLRTMFDAMSRYDDWLARYRNTRGTGGVEAFCTFDTGHDLSPRFWFVPERGYRGDAREFDPASAILPFVAPDLTANVACQREYLARIAEELGEDPAPWRARAEASLAALWSQCYDQVDGTFYDRDSIGAVVRVQSDVLLRVLACEVGDDEFFAAALERYLMNTRKFLAHFGFTSLALDDPRFDHDYSRNSWGGPSNFLSLIRAPQAFEHHGRVAELALTAMPVLSAVIGWDRFPQCLDPWTGSAGFTEVYSPSILWLLDAVERHCGILERYDGETWLSGLAPTRLDHGAAVEALAYSRVVGGAVLELVGDDERTVCYRDGERWLKFPRGWRVIVDARGEVSAVVGLASASVEGELVHPGGRVALTLAPNERVDLGSGVRRAVGFTPPRG
jgi:hypothetical protein